MDADIFLTEFGHLAQSEDGIKKLRNVILKLAVCGKLVAQNPNDESAESLLKRMNVKKTSSDRNVSIPFIIPASWRWAKLGEICTLQIGKTPSRKETTYWSEAKYPWVSIADLKHLSTITSTKEGISELAAQECFNSRFSPKGTLVMSFKLTIGKTSFLGMDAYHNEAIISIFPKIDDLKIFMFWALSGLDLTTEQSNAIKGNTLNREKLENLDFPLPPLDEQKRIVAKVDELMALCDRLEAEQNAQHRIKTQAVQSTLHHLTSAKSPSNIRSSLNILERTFGNWFDDLAAVKHLRATILQLAVQGKLVAQDPSDEPASELLKRTYIEKKKIVGTKSNITDFYIKSHAELPPGWVLTLIETLGLIRGGKRIPKSYGFSENPTNHVYIRVTDMKGGAINLTNLKYISEEVFAQIKNYTISKNDVYVTIAGTIGECGKVPDELDGMNLTENAAKISPYTKDLICNDYLILAIQSDYIQKQFKLSTNQQAQPKLALNKIASTVIPFPPLAEQKRIVAKVDELMILCDQLEAHITHTQTLNTHLMDSLIHRLTQAA